MANKKGGPKESKTKATSKLRSASPSSRYGLSETDLDQMGESTDSSGPRSATSSPAESEKGSEGAIVSADVDSSPIGEDYLKLEKARRSAASVTQLRGTGAAGTPASAESAASSTVWMDAGTQIFFSYTLCIGCQTTLSSYNKYTNDCYKDCIYLCLLNSGTSILAGFAVFSTLGFMAYEQGVPIDEVAESGPGLIFIVYPYAISMMPLPQLWTFCLFLMVFLLGLDTQFMTIEIIMATTKDLFAHLLQKERYLQALLLLICISSYLLGLPMLTEGGIYIFQIIDYYGCSGTCFLFIAIFQSIGIGWIYVNDLPSGFERGSPQHCPTVLSLTISIGGRKMVKKIKGLLKEIEIRPRPSLACYDTGLVPNSTNYKPKGTGLEN
ncbi:S6A13 protein, partial [Polypterus senegalus]